MTNTGGRENRTMNKEEESLIRRRMHLGTISAEEGNLALAALDLLEAAELGLSNLIDTTDGSLDSEDAIRKLKLAIAKARGE